MSFILDALKKSEVERQRQAIPGLMDSRPLPPRAKFPLWAAALIALLVVNLLILAVVLTRHASPATASLTAPATASSTAPATAPVAAPVPAAPGSPPAAPGSSAPAAIAPAATSASAPSPAPRASAAPDHFSPMDAAPPVYAPEIPPTPDYPGARRSARAGASSEGTTHHAVSAAPDPVLTDSNPADAETLPSINEINVTDQPALANLHLDVHVYATQPSERFVYINMRKYREGATLAEGPVLERIRRDGVVLNYQGLRFVLPRQQ
jgi:general secretion pathway protein B